MARIDEERRGFSYEAKFESWMRSLGFTIERNDRNNLKDPDYLIGSRLELKYRETPFYTSEKKVGIPPERCAAIDVDKIGNYEAHNPLLFFRVNYTPHFPTNGLYIISQHSVLRAMKIPNRILYDVMDYGRGKLVDRMHLDINEMIEVDKGALNKERLFASMLSARLRV